MNERILPFLLTTAAMTPSLALAEGAAITAEPGSSALQVVLSLTLVVLLLIGSLYLLKRISGPRGAAAGLLRVVSSTAVGTRERVVLVEVGDTWLVLGVAPGSVTPLHHLPRMAKPPAEELVEPGKDFAGWLKQVMDRRNAR